MIFVERIFQKKCNICRRPKNRAIEEQVEKLFACGPEHCPFHQDIFTAISRAQQAELLEFRLSKSEELEGCSIIVTWKTRNCRRVTILNHGEVALSGQQQIQLSRGTTEIEINLEDLYGEIFEAKKPIKVLPKPTLEILEFQDKILKDECFFIRYAATDFSAVVLKSKMGEVICDLSNSHEFTSNPLEKDSHFDIHVTGKYGGFIQKEIKVMVFERPVVIHFESDVIELTDTLPIQFYFDYSNAIKAALFCDNEFLAEVTNGKTFTYIAINKTNAILFQRYELVITSFTGSFIREKLERDIAVYPQPSIVELRAFPDSIVLFPTQVTIFNRTSFCEKIIFSDGIGQSEISPNDSIVLNPAKTTIYSFKPFGMQDFPGEPQTLQIEIYHPIELQASADKKITLQNFPITISWQSKQHSKIIIEPGNIDVTHKSSYDIRLTTATSVKVIALNKMDRKEQSFFVEVLTYPKVEQKIFDSLPLLEINMPAIPFGKQQSIIYYLSKNLPIKTILTSKLSLKILTLIKNLFPKPDFNFNRSLRDKMSYELKLIKRKQKSV